MQRDLDRCYQVWRCAASPQIKEEDQPVDLTEGPDVVVVNRSEVGRRVRSRAHATVKPKSAQYGRRLPKYLEQNYVLY